MRRAAAPRSPRGAMSRSLSRLACALLLACLAAAFEPPSADWQRQMGAPVNATEAAALREEVREMARARCASGCAAALALRPAPRARSQFSFTYDSYMLHAFPRDELRPMSCAGHVRSRDATRRARVAHGAPAPAQDTLGGYALTLVDALDSIALMGAPRLRCAARLLRQT